MDSLNARPFALRRPLLLVFAGAAALALLAAAVLLLPGGSGRARAGKSPRRPAPAPAYMVGDWSAPGMSPVIVADKLMNPAMELHITSEGRVAGKVAGATLRDAEITTWSGTNTLFYRDPFTHRIDALLEGMIDGKPYRADVLIAAREESGYWTAKVFLRRKELGLGAGGRTDSPLFAMHHGAPTPVPSRFPSHSSRPKTPSGPPVVVKRLPRLTVQTHEWIETGQLVYYQLLVEGGEIDRSRGIYGTDGEIWVRVDGVEYHSHISGSFLCGCALTTALPDTLEDAAGGRLRLAPGRHRLAVICRPDNAVRKTLFVTTPLTELISNEVEFTLVPTLPPGYLAPVSKPEWDRLLREKISEVRYGSWAPSGDPKEIREQSFLSFTFLHGIPFDLACDVSLESEDKPGRRIHAGTLNQTRTDGPRSSDVFGSTFGARDLDVMALERGCWRVILTPSHKVAATNPAIRNYYGREFVSDWAILRPDDHWIEQCLQRLGAMPPGEPGGGRDYDYHTTPRPMPRNFDGSVSYMRGEKNPLWPYGTGADVEQMATQDGGGARIYLPTGVRLLPLPDATGPIDATLKARERRAELKASTVDRLAPVAGKAVYAAILTDQNALFVLQIEALSGGKEKWWRWLAEDRPKDKPAPAAPARP